MLTLVALVCISFGGMCLTLAFRKGYQTVAPLVVGVALIALGFYVLPSSNDDVPDVYYRK